MMIKYLTAAMIMLLSTHSSLAGVYRPEKRWRGFNLLEMFVKGSSMSPGKFKERDFREINQLGFNFARLPLDYRFWIKDENWELIDEAALAPLDEAVDFGRKHSVHVMLNLHRAPGYTVARPREKLNVFKDDEALRVCVKHWRMLAERYKDIPAAALSFNLFNEPVATAEQYEKVVVTLIKAIRDYNPERLVVCDGLDYGNKIVPELFKYDLGQATRGYSPGGISHYRASWAGNPTAPPAWPPTGAVSPLYGPMKKAHSKPLIIEGLPACRIFIDLGRVSGNVTFEVKADHRVIDAFALVPTKGAGWSKAEYKEEWKIYQANCETIQTVDIPADAGRVSINIVKGDWAGIDAIKLRNSSGQEAVLSFESAWYKSNPVFLFKGFDSLTPFAVEGGGSGVDWLNSNIMAAWARAAKKGELVMAGEFGAYKHTPHEIVLEWMEDYLKIWKQADMGWALWNFDGSFGIINSGREDVRYEDFHGRKLDRKMLELLRQY